MNYQIKENYSRDISTFVENGGKIRKAVNTNKVSWNGLTDQEKCVRETREMRATALAKGDKVYRTIMPCKHCSTFERSTKTNLCLVCDRRRNKLKQKPMTDSQLFTLANLLLESGSQTVVIEGKKYSLAVTEITEQ